MTLAEQATDMAVFWRDTIGRARAGELSAVTERLSSDAPYLEYMVTYRSFGAVPVRARLAVPIIGERPASPMPAIVTAPGYGGREFGVQLNECQRGYIVLQVYPRGQGESGALWRVQAGAERDWLRHGCGAAEGFYYQGAYMDMLRGLDYLRSRPDVDATCLALVGTSQGGALALAGAALDGEVRAVVAHLPYLCRFHDNACFAGTELGRDPAFRDLFHRFDPWALAPWIRCPVLLSAGGQDAISPPETIAAVAERITTPCELQVYPTLSHTSCGDFYRRSWDWLEAVS